MQVTREAVSKTQEKLTIVVSPEELQPFLKTAALHVSEHMDIPGFRRGKATYEAVVNQVGPMRVLEEALEPAVNMFLRMALEEQEMKMVGQPRLEIQKMVPGQALEFTAEVARMPEVTKLGDYTKLTVEAKSTKATEEQITQALKDLTRMQTKEVRGASEEMAGVQDMLVIDMDMTADGVPLEGGQAHGFRVLLNEPELYVPGMVEPLVGMKEGEEKRYTLTFPKKNVQKHLAGRTVDVQVKALELYHLESPEVDDAFAQSLGLKDAAELQQKISENLEQENTQEETQRQERAMLELLAEKSTFEELPENLVQDEVEKMVHELEHAIEKQGGVFADYLASIDKTPTQLKESFNEQARVRVQVALVLEAVAKKEQLSVSDEELTAEVEKQLALYKESDEARERIASQAYRQYLAYRLRNEKTIAFLKEQMVR